MYRANRRANLGDSPTLGWWQFVVGAVDIGTQAGLKAGTYASEKKYQTKTKRLLRQSRAETESLQDKELAQKTQSARQHLDLTRSQTGGFKKLLVMGLGAAILVSVIGLGVFYISARGGAK
jgi:hypothetical protein